MRCGRWERCHGERRRPGRVAERRQGRPAPGPGQAPHRHGPAALRIRPRAGLPLRRRCRRGGRGSLAAARRRGGAVRPRTADALGPARAIEAERLEAAHRRGSRGALSDRDARGRLLADRVALRPRHRRPRPPQDEPRGASDGPARRGPPGTVCLVDGFNVPAFEFEQRAVIDGDCRSAAIAAASVLAKVSRDRYMRRAAERHPGWDFETNVGYSTPEHRAAIAAMGVSPCTGCPSSRSRTRSWRSRARGESSPAARSWLR